jgi:hypothetical protein
MSLEAWKLRSLKDVVLYFLLQSGLLYPSFNLHAHGNKWPLLRSINSHRLVLFAFLLASSTPSMFKSKPITNGCVNANEQKKQKKVALHGQKRKKEKKRTWFHEATWSRQHLPVTMFI